jgi:glycosyltransferase involved in cell wall biosynthesis
MIDLSRVTRAQAAIAPSLLVHIQPIVRRFRPHVMHANNLYFQTTLAAALLGRSLSVPLVTSAHIGSVGHLGRPLRWIAGAYERVLGQFILHRSVRVIAVSESVRSHLLRLGLSNDRVNVVENGVDHERFRPSVGSTRGHEIGVPLIVFIGRLIANKGPQVLVDALARLHQEGEIFRAMFVGDGPARATLQRRVRTHHIERLVDFAGQVSDVAPVLQEADIFVRPSFSEGMSLAVLEGLASRVCIVASDIPGNRDLITDRVNGRLVQAGSVALLTAAIGELLRDPLLRDRLAEAGYQTAQAYSWERTANGTADILAAAASRD